MNYRTRHMLNYRDAAGDGLLWRYWGFRDVERHPQHNDREERGFWAFVLFATEHEEENEALNRRHKMTITFQQYATIIRAVTNYAGGALVTSGVISDSTSQAVIGIILPIASVVWGLFVHSPAAVVAQAEDIKAKGLA